MAETFLSDVSPPNKRTARIQWFWIPKVDGFPRESGSAAWTNYLDVENEIIEEAYNEKKKYAILDDGCVDFESHVHLARDGNIQRFVKRASQSLQQNRFRAARFSFNPISPKSSFTEVTDFRDPIFLKRITGTIELNRKESDDKVHELLEPAISGILKEGILLGKQREAEWICDQLKKVKDCSSKEIGNCCVNLYTRDSFLYRIVNDTMRLCGEKEQEHLWLDKEPTLAPIAWILFQHVVKEGRSAETVYRGVNLTQAMIDEYIELAACSKMGTQSRSFQAFTSCSRNRALAEMFGNTLFVIRVLRTFRTLDISHLSSFPEEEEMLLPSGISFGVESVEYDSSRNKHIVKVWIPFYDPQDN